ncbi:MAG TPA: hypothetical protein VMT93_08245 [Gemmatimonadaceae bacterium]|nr:hypothetical protein [Gemmatimonadaceae bacterium]
MSLAIPKDHPDHHDAELILRLYELRREPVLRAARDALYTGFTPRRYEDIKAIAMDREHPLNAPLRQVQTYWEMVYGMAKHGIVHADFLVENNGEGLILFSRVEPWLKEIRAELGPGSYVNAEWVATHCEEGKKRFARFKAMAEKARAAK